MFCGHSCSARYSNRFRNNPTEEQRRKISESLKRTRREHPELFSHGKSHSISVGKGTKGKYKKEIKSILDVSKRTMTKILKRMNIGCCICGWKESSCDVHHINGKKVTNANSHWNLTYICPNHHRMFHNGVISKDVFISLDKYFPDNWRDFYYG